MPTLPATVIAITTLHCPQQSQWSQDLPLRVKELQSGTEQVRAGYSHPQPNTHLGDFWLKCTLRRIQVPNGQPLHVLVVEHRSTFACPWDRCREVMRKRGKTGGAGHLPPHPRYLHRLWEGLMSHSLEPVTSARPPGFSSPDFIDSVQLILSGLSNHFLAWKMWSLLDHWLKTTLELLFDSSKVFQLALVYFGGG